MFINSEKEEKERILIVPTNQDIFHHKIDNFLGTLIFKFYELFHVLIKFYL